MPEYLSLFTRVYPGAETLVELGGIYHHEMVRTPAGWRSRRLVEELVWKRGL